MYAGGELRIDNSVVSIQADQGFVNGNLKLGDRFQLNNPSGSELEKFFGEFERPNLTITAVNGDVRIVDKSIIRG